MEGGIRPVYTFEVLEENAAPSSSGRGMLIFGLLLLCVTIIVIIFASIASYNQKQINALQPRTTTQGMEHPCPPYMQNLAKCWVIHIPANGEWVRFPNPTTRSFSIPAAPGIAARDCGGEVYDLTKGSPVANSSCGYIDYRGTDGQSHTINEGAR